MFRMWSWKPNQSTAEGDPRRPQATKQRGKEDCPKEKQLEIKGWDGWEVEGSRRLMKRDLNWRCTWISYHFTIKKRSGNQKQEPIPGRGSWRESDEWVGVQGLKLKTSRGGSGSKFKSRFRFRSWRGGVSQGSSQARLGRWGRSRMNCSWWIRIRKLDERWSEGEDGIRSGDLVVEDQFLLL